MLLPSLIASRYAWWPNEGLKISLNELSFSRMVRDKAQIVSRKRVISRLCSAVYIAAADEKLCSFRHSWIWQKKKKKWIIKSDKERDFHPPVQH